MIQIIFLFVYCFVLFCFLEMPLSDVATRALFGCLGSILDNFLSQQIGKAYHSPRKSQKVCVRLVRKLTSDKFVLLTFHPPTENSSRMGIVLMSVTLSG